MNLCYKPSLCKSNAVRPDIFVFLATPVLDLEHGFAIGTLATLHYARILVKERHPIRKIRTDGATTLIEVCGKNIDAAVVFPAPNEIYEINLLKITIDRNYED